MTGFSTSLARDLNIFHRALSNPVRLKRLKFRFLKTHPNQVITKIDSWKINPSLVTGLIPAAWMSFPKIGYCEIHKILFMSEILEFEGPFGKFRGMTPTDF